MNDHLTKLAAKLPQATKDKILALPRKMQVAGLREALAEDLEMSMREAGDEFYKWAKTQPQEEHETLLHQHIMNNASSLPQVDQDRILVLPRREAIAQLKIALDAKAEAERRLMEMQAQRDEKEKVEAGKELEENMKNVNESFDSEKMAMIAAGEDEGEKQDGDDLEHLMML